MVAGDIVRGHQAMSAAMARKPALPDTLELTQRLERIRKLCDELETARGAANDQRDLISKMQVETDAMRRSLKLHRND